MKCVQVDSEIRIEHYMGQIRKMAVRALANMNHRAGYTLDDMIGEGILVFYKDALPHHIRKGEVGYRANFKSFLTVCLRNHYYGMSVSSFRKAANDDTFDIDPESGRMVQVQQDPKEVYTARRDELTAVMSPDEQASFNIMMEEIKGSLDDRENTYLEMVMVGHSRKEIRTALGVSSITERKIRRNLQKKMRGLAQC